MASILVVCPAMAVPLIRTVVLARGGWCNDDHAHWASQRQLVACCDDRSDRHRLFQSQPVEALAAVTTGRDAAALIREQHCALWRARAADDRRRELAVDLAPVLAAIVAAKC